MRTFSSYGPVNSKVNFAVERRRLVDQAVAQLIGEEDEGGHYFTIWAPRQTGKTWIMRRAMDEIRARHGDRFTVATLCMQGVLGENDPDDLLLPAVPLLIYEGFGFTPPAPSDWNGFSRLFARDGGVFDRPLILLIDEFDCLPPSLIDRLVAHFRKMFLTRGAYFLHGLALVGVRAVLGLNSDRGSPFNVQRSLHVPNLTEDEVVELFRQYQAESKQDIEPEVVREIFYETRGQPGLVSWFGELLTERYNRRPDQPITTKAWEYVLGAAYQVEPNNTVLNLVKKARGPYLEHVVSLFTRQNTPFSFDKAWSNFLYMNGIIDYEETTDAFGRLDRVCRFASPFVQLRLYNALTDDLIDEQRSMLPLEPLDTLDDVFSPAGLDLPALLGRYRGYLARLKQRGLDPWKEQPRRQDTHFYEAVGHFHLYAWLQAAIGRRCIICPEFPTGNGKVDLLLRTHESAGVIEVKSFREAHELPAARRQAARYAASQELSAATLALFVPTEDEAVLTALSGRETIGKIVVTTVAIGWQ